MAVNVLRTVYVNVFHFEPIFNFFKTFISIIISVARSVDGIM